MLTIKNGWRRFKEWMTSIIETRNVPSRASLIKLGIGIVSLLIFVSLIGAFQRAIRNSQINALVGQEIKDANLKQIAYDELDQTIGENSAITVLFVSPNAKNYDNVLMELAKKKQGLNRKIFIYPMIYNEKEILKNYRLKKNETTFLFFQSKKEKNRLVYDSLENPSEKLMDELNRLPMWNIID